MPEAPDLSKYHFKRKLEEIQAAEGRGTELISLYVPPTKQISDVANYLRNELSESSNIKSKSTKKAVMGAIESILSRLKHYRKPPENGMVFFVGQRQIGAEKTEQVAYVIEPPESVVTDTYRCDSRFYTEPLEEMLQDRERYGLIVIDRSEATVGLLRGKRIEPIKNVQSLIPSKHSKGGQSARRFERLIEIAAHEFYKKIGNLVNEAFVGEDMEGLLIGGPGATKEAFAAGNYIHHELSGKVIGTFDTGYTDEYGLRELVQKAQDALSDLALMKEKRLVQRLFDEIRKPDGGLAAYGEDRVLEALTAGAVDTLIVSEGLRRDRVTLKCNECGRGEERSAEAGADAFECSACGSPMAVDSRKDVIDHLQELTDSTGSRLEMVSADSEEGVLLVKAFAGLAALLRFKVSG